MKKGKFPQPFKFFKNTPVQMHCPAFRFRFSPLTPPHAFRQKKTGAIPVNRLHCGHSSVHGGGRLAGPGILALEAASGRAFPSRMGQWRMRLSLRLQRRDRPRISRGSLNSCQIKLIFPDISLLFLKKQVFWRRRSNKRLQEPGQRASGASTCML